MKTNWFVTVVLLLCFSCKQQPFMFQEDYDLSIMSFNLRFDTAEDGEHQWNNRQEACLALLRELAPAIFGIQEGLNHQVDYLEDQLPDYAYVGVGRDDGDFSGEYAAIFFNTNHFELVESNSFWLSETPDIPSLGWDGNNIRIVTWAHLIDLETDRSIFIFNTHFDHKGKRARKESAKLLMQKIKEIVPDEIPVFLVGDFNALISNQIFDPILEEFYSARRFASYSDNIKSFNFWGRWLFTRNIDFIFYRHAMALSFRTVSEDYGVPFVSDHYPIIAHFNYSN